MMSEESHLSDQELLRAADGELSTRDAARVESHLSVCSNCRSRKKQFEATMSEFVHSQRSAFNSRISAPDGPRALLKAQLAHTRETRPGSWVHQFTWPIAAAACVLAVIAYFTYRDRILRQPARVIAVSVPNPSLTPGATILLSQSEVCMESGAKNKDVPVALRRRVFDEYGIRSAAANAYEVDYLITPALGGADDIHNLWPQAYSATVWNARVKDALEDHLRDLVCDGQLDLATAQREIATNWIEAYKKYFHTDRPLTRYR